MKKTFLMILLFTFSISETFACSCAERNESLSKKVGSTADLVGKTPIVTSFP